MLPIELTNFITNQLKQNISETSIRANLLSNGWNQTLIDEAFRETNSTTVVAPSSTNQFSSSSINSQNTSGMGDSSTVPEEIKGWSWGGFIWSWIWAIGNKVWIGLLALVPIPLIGLIMQIILGINGREWAWREKHWDSIDQFNSTQKKWTIWGLVIVGLAILGVISIFAMLMVNPQQSLNHARCITLCQKSSNPEICLSKCNKLSSQLPAALPTLAINSQEPPVLPSPTLFSPSPLPTQIEIPTKIPIAVPTRLPTIPPISSNFQSSGTQTLENGITAIVTSANLSANILSINITFTNPSASAQNANLIRLQIHDQKLMAGTKENYLSASLAAKESRNFNLTFDALPNPPFKIEYAMPDGSSKNLGTYTP